MVTYSSSQRRPNFPSGNASICPKVSFVVAVRASSSVIADKEKVSPSFGNGISRGHEKDTETPNVVYADLAAKEMSTHKSPINVSNSIVKPRTLIVALLGDDVPAST